jgi:glycosyltransferase involved in cell wall biosynthesis
MPIYNGEATIAAVLDTWISELDRLQIDYEFLLYDDGSNDRSGELAAVVAAGAPHLHVRRHANRGHGATILRGYKEARGEWLLQIDSDGEMGPEGFEKLWALRVDYDFLVGSRYDRESPVARRVVTAGSRCAVRLLFGKGVQDVNSPYRLMRASRFRPLYAMLRDQTFAPNVILSGLAARTGLRTYEAPVPHITRETVTRALNRWKLWKTAFRCFRETVGVALSAGR